MGSNVFLVLHRAKAEASAALDLQMSVEMLDRSDDPLALLHAGACTKGNGVTFFACAQRSVGLVGVAPGRASVDEGLELSGDVSPIRW